jgi:glutaminyl-peptide cyclotransferase
VKNSIWLGITAFTLLFFFSCDPEGPKDKPDPKPDPVKVEAPVFNQDNAYQFIEKQLSFGPRVPETPAHDSCAAWLVSKFKEFGAEVQIQEAEVYGHKGKTYKIKNIVAVFNPQAKSRVLLTAHWDTRAVADQDTERKEEPILGADDGGSGVGILLEMARVFGATPLKNTGIDIVLFDAEDQGGSGAGYVRESWCLGAQHWSKNPHVKGYTADFGVLLDMAGARGARFAKEGVSMKHASHVVQEIWETAWELQYSDFFVNVEERQIVDDHVFVNEIRKIPTVDIINLPENSPTGFGSYWHTHRDNMDIISKSTLKAVGQTLLQLIYQKDAGQ